MIVYFSCQGCGTSYSAVQEPASAPLKSSGLFVCMRCGKPVHHWSGAYSYTDWKRMEFGDSKDGSDLL
ncbi:hypothetical protein ABIF21_002492 [Bradyrhizobium elkanii]|jgi:hypothetical protein|nr:hypothetical protein [Bradyrhizobium elkanii]MCS4106339.1 hypothetical protein [Bradyrhizobium elkanii]MCW2117119.1 hypothetical protein [Bradyrhizobium elkanii]MCW2127837.1 hypothetical protein [Bradyrhizobium elkanii]MCW2174580.1 hypothetical protein [Bradyrhizobium elkanii]